MLSITLILILANGFFQVNCQNEFLTESTTEKQITENATGYIFESTVKVDAKTDYAIQGKIRKKHSEHLGTVKSDAQQKPSPKSKQTRKSGKEIPLKTPAKLFPGKEMLSILAEPQSHHLKPEVETEPSSEPDNSTESDTEPVTEIFPEESTEVAMIPPQELSEESTVSGDSESGETILAEDPVERQINEAINSIPKLPELVLSDNKTYIKFHKDLEEKLIDEKITEIARRLAEESLRKEYEEQKLRKLAEQSWSKPSKSKGDEISTLGPENKGSSTLPSLVVTATEAVDPEPKTYETVTNFPEILKTNKSQQQAREINEMIKMKNKVSSLESEALSSVEPVVDSSIGWKRYSGLYRTTPLAPLPNDTLENIH